MPERKSFSQRLMALDWLWGPLGILIAIGSGLAFVLYCYWPVITQPGIVPGADPTSFAHTAKMIVDYFKAHGSLPVIDPTWYAGFELRQAPPLIYFVLGSIYYLIHNIDLTMKIFHPVGTFLIFLSMFYLMRKEGYQTLNAWLAAMLFAFMPSVFASFSSYTKVLAIIFLPLAFYATNQILIKNSLKHLVYLAFLIMLVIYSHPMNGIVFGMFLSMYAVIYAIVDRQIITRRFFLVIGAIGLGFLLSSQYVVPFLFEKVGRTTLPPEEVVFNFGFGRLMLNYIAEYGGALFGLIPLYVAIRKKIPKITATYLAAVLSTVIYFAYYFNIGFFFPFNMSYGYIWIYTADFAFAYVLALVIPWSKIQSLGPYFLRIGLAILIIAFSFFMANKYVDIFRLANYQYEKYPADVQISQELSKYDNPGRVMISHYPFGLVNYMIANFTNRKSVEGHYFGISRIGTNIALMADAIHNSKPEYVINELKHLNVRYFVANQYLQDMYYQDPKTGEKIYVGLKMIDELLKNGYKFVYQTPFNSDAQGKPKKDSYKLFYLDKPSTYVMPVKEKIFAIGKYSYVVAAEMAPLGVNVLEGRSSGSEYFDDYSLDFLKNFDTIVLYGFGYRDKVKAEDLARAYVAQGGHLVVDLFNMEVSPLADGPNFLGVTTCPIKLKEAAQIQPLTNGLAKMIPTTFDIPGEIYDPGTGVIETRQLKEWNAVEYIGLDQSLARLKTDENIASIFGYKNIGTGEVTFIGLNFFYHLYNTNDKNEAKFIKSLIQGNIQTGEAIDTDAREIIFANDYLKYQLHSPTNQLWLISLAYSKHWKAYINGQPTPVKNIDNLMVIQTPAGSNVLELKYESTAVSILGWLLSGLTLVILIFMLIYSKFYHGNINETEAGR